MNDAPLPLRRPINEHSFKGHDKPLSHKNIMLRLGVTFVLCNLVFRRPSGT